MLAQITCYVKYRRQSGLVKPPEGEQQSELDVDEGVTATGITGAIGMGVYSMLSRLAMLCLAHRSWMFSATSEDPPFE